MITLRNITLRRGSSVLLKEINWTIYPKQHIGLVGENGSGKTSLFALIRQELAQDIGDLTIQTGLRLAHVAQETPAYSASALDYVLDGDGELRALQQELAAAEAINDGTTIAAIYEQLSQIDAYTANARAAQLLAGLSFNTAEQLKSVSEFSGGWRMRLNLARALMCRSDVLLLDEPTNHLDLDAVLWLEQWLMKYPGTLLLISHDRDFLDSVVDQVAHITDGQILFYTGNYSSFEKQRAEQLVLQQMIFVKQQKKLAHLQSFVNRFRAKATKSRQAQSRLKAIEKMELVSAVHADSPFQFEFKTPSHCPNPLVSLAAVSLSYDEKVILANINLNIGPKDRIALIGPNGAGKSSLIKLLAGELQPTSGLRTMSTGVKIGYFAQHQVDRLDLAATPLQHLRNLAPNQAEASLRTFLGSFGFSGETVLSCVANFSGGEKSRLALALLVWQEPNLLLLDEPTNHLDLEMRHALSIALQEYAGAMILVSHDRFLLRSSVDNLLLVADSNVIAYEGDLDEYGLWLLDYRKQQAGNGDTVQAQELKKLKRKADIKLNLEQKGLNQEINKLENKFTKLKNDLAEIETLLANNDLYTQANTEKLKAAIVQQKKLRDELETTEMTWLLACEKKDSLAS
jgi:ATP-binding cassette subfamily F protein 3